MWIAIYFRNQPATNILGLGLVDRGNTVQKDLLISIN